MTFLGHGPSVNNSPALARPGCCWAWSVSAVAMSAARVGGVVGLGLQCGPPGSRPSLDVCQSRPMASALPKVGRLPNAASAQQQPRILGQGDRSGWGIPCRQARGASSPGLPADPWLVCPWSAWTFDCRPPPPGSSPDGEALLARRLDQGRCPSSQPAWLALEAEVIEGRGRESGVQSSQGIHD